MEGKQRESGFYWVRVANHAEAKPFVLEWTETHRWAHPWTGHDNELRVLAGPLEPPAAPEEPRQHIFMRSRNPLNDGCAVCGERLTHKVHITGQFADEPEHGSAARSKADIETARTRLVNVLGNSRTPSGYQVFGWDAARTLADAIEALIDAKMGGRS